MNTFLLITIVAFPMHFSAARSYYVEQHFSAGPFRSFASCETAGREVERRRQASSNVTVQWFCTIQ